VNRLPGLVSWDISAGTGQQRRADGTGQPGQDSLESSAGTGQPGQDSQERWSAWTGQQARQLPEMSARDKLVRQYSLDRTDGQVSRDRAALTGQPEQVSLDRSARTGQLRQLLKILYSNGVVPTCRVLNERYSTRNGMYFLNSCSENPNLRFYVFDYSNCFPSTYIYRL
jgi:hypothetical protein